MTVVVAPADTPVSLAAARQHVRVGGTSRDDILTIYLAAATDAVERWLGRALIDQTLDLVLDAFPEDGKAIELLRPPLIELLGVFYVDGGGVEQEVDAAAYVVDASAAVPRLSLNSGQSWPTARAAAGSVRIRYRAGYLDVGVSPPAASVPPSIKAGILVFVGDLYANPESYTDGGATKELPGFVERWLRPFRVNLGMA
ncbi:MAG: phage head-tail connector protein [Phenylobacterium sp.]|nr:phage head-tail connector protein [Phenylobacterium sp.]